jgi:hypothetical protein
VLRAIAETFWSDTSSRWARPHQADFLHQISGPTPMVDIQVVLNGRPNRPPDNPFCWHKLGYLSSESAGRERGVKLRSAFVA